MRKRAPLTSRQKVDIIEGYRDQLTPMIELAATYGVTRQAIYKIIRKAGIDTSKGQLTVTCSSCGKTFPRTKARVRRQLHHFCSKTCYFAFLEAGNGFPYIQNRHGQRIARSVVSEHFALQEGHIVHHENRNTLDNRLENLKVFAGNGDHVRHHRGFDVTPIWEGNHL